MGSFPGTGPPPSARVCDAVSVAFGLWTVCANAVVAAGGTLPQLVAAYVAAGAAALASWRWLRGRRPAAGPDAAPQARPPRERGRVRRALQGAGLAVGLGATLVFHFQGGVIALWVVGVGVLGVAAVAFVLLEPVVREAPVEGPGWELCLWALGLACVVVTLMSHRPDVDDAFYVNLAVSAVDLRDQPLLSADTLHGAAELPLLLPVYRLHGWELWNGALAWLSGLPAIEVFHWVSASLAALLVPLAYARVFRWLAPREWLWATAAVVFVLLAAGETHRWYGNFAFVRMWQGKAVCLFVFLPLIYAYAIELGLRPSAGAWLRLALAQIAALGCSSSALWGGPAAALMALACVLRPSREGLRRFALGAAASAYVLGVGVLMKLTMQSGGHGPTLANKDWTPGLQLERAIAIVLGVDELLAFAVAATLASWALCRRGLAQRFAIVVPLAVLVVLLNPFTAKWVVANVTSSSYWRALWALPVPMLMALVLIAPLRLGRGRASRVAAAAATLAGMAAFAVFVPRFSALSPRNGGSGHVGMRFGKPGLKVDRDAWRWARALNDAVPPGSVVIAPADVSVWLPMFHRHARPLEVRPSYLRMYRRELGEQDIKLRHMLGRFAEGRSENPDDFRYFSRALDRFGVRGVLVRRSPRLPETRRILREHGFELQTRGTDHEIWVIGGST